MIIKYECHFPSNKESACKAGDPGSIPRSERSPGGGHGHPLQYSCLENPVDRGAWRATVHRVVNSRTRLKQLSRKAGHLSTMVISGLVYKPSKGFTFRKTNSKPPRSKRRHSGWGALEIYLVPTETCWKDQTHYLILKTPYERRSTAHNLYTDYMLQLQYF